jgi:hypothetical protein
MKVRKRIPRAFQNPCSKKHLLRFLEPIGYFKRTLILKTRLQLAAPVREESLVCFTYKIYGRFQIFQRVFSNKLFPMSTRDASHKSFELEELAQLTVKNSSRAPFCTTARNDRWYFVTSSWMQLDVTHITQSYMFKLNEIKLSHTITRKLNGTHT